MIVIAYSDFKFLTYQQILEHLNDNIPNVIDNIHRIYGNKITLIFKNGNFE